MIRKAEIKDLKEIQQVFACARAFMKKTGNPDQWGDSYPSEAVLLEDIKKGQLYVVEEAEILGAFVFFVGNEPTYDYIKGKWLDASSYGVIHRVANGCKITVMFSLILDFAEKNIGHLRIDTHKDNLVMQHVLEKHGFKKCGIIYLADKTERIGYEKV